MHGFSGTCDVGQRVEELPEHRAERRAGEGPLAHAAHPEHDVGPARVHLGGEVGEPLRLLLEVDVEHEDAPPPRVGEPGHRGRVMAEVARQLDQHDTRVARGELAGDGRRGVGRAVVHVHELEAVVTRSAAASTRPWNSRR